MSIAGRMSVFILLVLSTPKMAISEQRTAMVYGRRSASRTIHIGALCLSAIPMQVEPFGCGCRAASGRVGCGLRAGAAVPPGDTEQEGAHHQVGADASRGRVQAPGGAHGQHRRDNAEAQ